MAALHLSSHQWLPHDDFLLKTSIEGGASLESLARGAVEFSQKFTINELQDRWLSLLYDPAVSAQACARMAEFETSAAPSKSKKVDISNNYHLLSREKRKVESVRTCYYARKRVLKEPFYEGDRRFFTDNSFINHDDTTCLEGVPEDPFEINNFGMQDDDYDGLYNAGSSVYNFLVGGQNSVEYAIDRHTTMDEQISSLLGDFVQIGETCGSEDFPGYKLYESNDPVVHLTPELANLMSSFDPKSLTDCMDDGFAEIMDINFTKEDKMQITNDEASLEDFHALLLNSLDYINDDQVSSIPVINGLGDVGETRVRESNIQSRSENQTSTSESPFDPPFPEYVHGVICCVFNTEDPEIPCNDDIIFPSKQPASGNKRIPNKVTVPPSLGKDNTNNHALRTMNMEPKLIKKSNCTQNLEVGSDCVVMGLAGTQRRDRGSGGLCKIGTGIKEHPDFSDRVVEKSCQIADSNDADMNIGGMNLDGKHIPSALDSPNFAVPILREVENELLLSEDEQQYSDSDAGIPSFSDVESMILGMDLCPANQDTHCAAKVAKYQQEDALKEIIRLEQNARSCIQRDMEAHGAFAVLSGRRSKHYIKKSEILLGRPTGAVNVDIDLTREGRANMVSRRQASIKISKDGTFRLNNLGRCTIYVNGKTICHGQTLDLHSDCLIEIRGMSFIFTVNEQRAKLYLGNAVQ